MDLATIFLSPTLWAMTLSLGTPIALAALGGTFSERSGVVNIAMEGIMLTAAFFAVFFSSLTGNAWLGLLLAVACGLGMGLLMAWAAVHLRADQIVIGTAVNMIAAGLTAYLLHIFFGQGSPSNTPQLPVVTIPGLAQLPFVGDVIGHQNVMVYITIGLFILAHYVLFHTVFGLRLRSAGENPQATESAGLSVYRLRYLGVLIGAFLSALGGAYLSIGVLNSFTQNMTSGRGYIALAAMIFGKWTPWGAFGAAMLFGWASALGYMFQGTSVPYQLVLILPYVLTVVALVGLVGRSRPPAADGIPYVHAR
ncbi:MAG: ABC transporter permease [Firmicutes bacterium]|nr:ABC transporter permease [Bacillota bacterium]